MPYKNYTTQISVDRTSAEIRTMLRAAGATAILEEYDQAHITALSFKFAVNGQVLPFRLPLRVDGVLKVLQADAAKGRIRRTYANREQAERIAWRVLRDWVAVQMAVIEAGVLEMTEVFAAHLLVDGQHTVHEVLIGGQFLLPEGPGK